MGSYVPCTVRTYRLLSARPYKLQWGRILNIRPFWITDPTLQIPGVLLTSCQDTCRPDETSARSILWEILPLPRNVVAPFTPQIPSWLTFHLAGLCPISRGHLDPEVTLMLRFSRSMSHFSNLFHFGNFIQKPMVRVRQ